MRVLITGAAGLIGRHLVPALETEHDLRLGDLQAINDSRYVPLDVTQPESVFAAVDGMDAVVHLAVASGQEGDFEDTAFNQLRFDVNVRGTYNVAHAAGLAGVKRFVHTSSLTVVWGYESPEWVPGDAEPRPVGTYALTKQLAEEVCRYTARAHEMSTVCLRIAKPIPLDDEFWKSHKLRPQMLAMPDLLQAYRLALTASEIDFETVTLVGESDRRRWDLSKAEQVLGYTPTCRLAELGFQLGTEQELLS